MIHIFLQSLVPHRGFPKTKENQGPGAVSGCRPLPLGHVGMLLGTCPEAVSAHGRSAWDLRWPRIFSGWWFGTWLLFFHILRIIIPTDFHIFRGVGIPPTRFCGCVWSGNGMKWVYLKHHMGRCSQITMLIGKKYGVSIDVIPRNGWFVMQKPKITWMITGGTPMTSETSIREYDEAWSWMGVADVQSKPWGIVGCLSLLSLWVCLTKPDGLQYLSWFYSLRLKLLFLSILGIP